MLSGRQELTVAKLRRKPARQAKEKILSPYQAFIDQSRKNPREWDFPKEDTQYSTHGLHTYLAAMNPPLARRLIQTFVPKEGSVFDPFCGGGAVLVEAVLNHRDAIGRDVNDLAVLISGAKTTYLNEKDVLQTGEQVLEKASHYHGEPKQFTKADYIHYWFKPSALRPLTALHYAVEEITERKLRRLFQVILSATVRDVSLTYRNEIRLRRLSDKEQAKFNPNVFERFQQRLRDAAWRVSQLPPSSKADVNRGNVMNLDFRNKEFTTIVCSPPYGDERNGVPYVQFAKNMLLWLGYSYAEISKNKQWTLGWEKDGKTAPPSKELEQVLELIKENPVSVKEAIAFYSDYYVALKEMARVVSDRVIIVIGQRVLNNKVFNNALITVELMENLGVPLESLSTRKLPTKRLPKLRANGGGAIDEETMLIFHV